MSSNPANRSLSLFLHRILTTKSLSGNKPLKPLPPLPPLFSKSKGKYGHIQEPQDKITKTLKRSRIFSPISSIKATKRQDAPAEAPSRHFFTPNIHPQPSAAQAVRLPVIFPSREVHPLGTSVFRVVVAESLVVAKRVAGGVLRRAVIIRAVEGSVVRVVERGSHGRG